MRLEISSSLIDVTYSSLKNNVIMKLSKKKSDYEVLSLPIKCMEVKQATIHNFLFPRLKQVGSRKKKNRGGA
jgi:hypothetical protein